MPEKSSPLSACRWLPVVGAATALSSLVVFIALARLVNGDSGLVAFDQTCAEHFRSHSEWRGFFAFLTPLGDTPWLTALCACGISILAWRRRHGLALAWLVAAVGGAVLTFSLKDVTNRQRPPLEWRDAAAMEVNPSFPSGHSTCSLITFGMFGFVSVRRLRRRRARVLVIAALCLIVLLIGFSRVYLRAHWCSDVLAGFSLGAAWLACCLTGLEVSSRWLRGRHARSAIFQGEQRIRTPFAGERATV